MGIRSFLKKFNWRLILPAIILSLFGLVLIYSICSGEGNFLNFKKQVIFFVVSLALSIFLSFFDLRFLKNNSRFVMGLYALSLILLILLLFFGTESRGMRGWYKIGQFSFDPVSLSGIILIIVLSKYFSSRHIETKRFKPILLSMFYLLIPFFLVLLQPDLGSAIVLGATWLGIIIFSGIELRHFLIIVLACLVIFLLAWNFWLKDYQKDRILAFARPSIDPQGVSWNANQSKIAIGSGGWFGKGIGNGSQAQNGFLPESHTDFIFSSIAEETGFFGIFVLLGLIGLLFWQIMSITFLAKDNFTRLFAAGFGFLILSQSFINIGMCLGILPVIGIPLPFVSYGGSQLLAFYLGLGILESLNKNTA